MKLTTLFGVVLAAVDDNRRRTAVAIGDAAQISEHERVSSARVSIEYTANDGERPIERVAS